MSSSIFYVNHRKCYALLTDLVIQLMRMSKMNGQIFINFISSCRAPRIKRNLCHNLCLTRLVNVSFLYIIIIRLFNFYQELCLLADHIDSNYELFDKVHHHRKPFVSYQHIKQQIQTKQVFHKPVLTQCELTRRASF